MRTNSSLLFGLYMEGVRSGEQVKEKKLREQEQGYRYRVVANLCEFIKKHRPHVDIHDCNNVVSLREIFFDIIRSNQAMHRELFKNANDNAILCMNKSGTVDNELLIYSHYLLGTNGLALTNYNKAFTDYKEYICHINQANKDSGINTDF